MLTDDRSRRSFFSARAPRGSHHAVDPSSHRSRRLRHGRHHRVDDTRPGPDRWSPTGRHTCPAHPQGRARGRVRRGDLRQAAGRLLLEPAALRRRPADHRRGCRAAHQSEQDARLDHEGCTAGRDPRRGVGRTGPEPDRAGRPDNQHLPGGVRAGSARSPSATTGRSSSARPRAASGPTTRKPAPGHRARNDTDTQSVGALAIAPSNDSIVYMGSGEGALSGDSYYGDGIYRSTNGGVTWQHVSTLFSGQAVSAIAVDPTKPQHLYAVHGARSRRKPPHVLPHQRAVRRLRVDQRRRQRGHSARAAPTSFTAPPTS